MSNVVFEMDKDLYFKGKGSLLKITRYLEVVNLSNCIKEAILIYKKLNTSYLKSVSNDGKIVGLERSKIMKYVDYFLNILILSSKTLSVDSKKSFIKMENQVGGFYFNLKERDYFWEAEGRLTHIMVSPVKNFSYLFNTKLSPEIITFLDQYKEASEDNFIDSKEMSALKKQLKQIIYFTVFLRFQVERCLVNG